MYWNIIYWNLEIYLNLENMELGFGFTILIYKFKNGKEKEIYWLIIKMRKKY